MKTETQAARINYVDYLRCFGIILMVLGHVGFGGAADHWVHAFHMPLWFFISGYFCNPRKKVLHQITKRVQSMLVPYCFFAIVYILLNRAISGQWCWEGMLYPNSVQVPLNGALWFLPALFWADCICYLAFRFIPSVATPIVLLAVSIAASVFPVHLPLSLDSALIGVGFYAAGYLVRHKAQLLLKLKLWQTLCLIAVCSVLAMVNGTVNVRANTYSIVPLFWLNALGLTIGFWNLSRFLYQIAKSKIAMEIGAESILYVCINQFLIYWLAMVPVNGGIIKLVWRLCMVVIVLAVCFFASRLIRRTPLRVLIGKTKSNL